MSKNVNRENVYDSREKLQVSKIIKYMAERPFLFYCFSV